MLYSFGILTYPQRLSLFFIKQLIWLLIEKAQWGKVISYRNNNKKLFTKFFFALAAILIESDYAPAVNAACRPRFLAMAIFVPMKRDTNMASPCIQSLINFGKTFFWITRIRNIAQTWFLARPFAYLSPRFWTFCIKWLAILFFIAWQWKKSIGFWETAHLPLP